MDLHISFDVDFTLGQKSCYAAMGVRGLLWDIKFLHRICILTLGHLHDGKPKE